MITQIESLSADWHEVDGQRLSGRAVVEDEDGIRLLVVNTRDLPAEDLMRAHELGASIVLVIDGGQWSWSLRSDLVESQMSNGLLRLERLRPIEPLSPSYRNLMTSTPIGVMLSDFVHLHAHSEMSALDGLSKVKEMVACAVADGNPGLGVTDHGVCAAHPGLQAEAEKAGIIPVFGQEANFVNDRHVQKPMSKPKAGSPEEDFEAWRASVATSNHYWHLILWAKDDVGLRNLWAASTEANREGFYRRPRMDWDTLARHSEGLVCSTACLRGPISTAILEDDEALARTRIGRLLEIFGDNLYIELGTNQLPDQIKVNQGLVVLAQSLSLPMVAVVDSHYPCQSDHTTHKIWLAAQTNSDLQDETGLFDGEEQYHLQTAAEVRNALSYLPETVVDEAMANTVRVTESCTARLRPRTTMPIFSKVGGKQADLDRLIDMCMEAWPTLIGKRANQHVYEERFVREMNLLRAKDFVWYYLVVADYVNHARKNGYLVGPGRGSGAGSLVAYLSGITGLDPIEHNLMFERFITEGRTALPDFDVDFPTSARDFIQNYIADKYGHDHVVRVGTQTFLRNKGAIDTMRRVLQPEADYMDFKKVSDIITDAERNSAGLGIPWEDLWSEHGDVLDPYRAKYPDVFDAADKVVGRLKSYGRHAAGWAISIDEPLNGVIPMRRGEEGSPHMVAEFGMNDFEFLNIPKFDLLTLRTLDTIQRAMDLIYEERGIRIDPNSWIEEYKDPDVWQMLCDGKTLGVFQIETSDGTKLTRRFGPRSIRDLADITTLVRPGPKRSGLTESYYRRKEGTEEVTLVDERLAEVLEPSWGVIIYQEQIMATCQILAGYTLSEADTVRSILGKKKVDKVAAEGEKFIPACIERGMPEDAVLALWDQMAEFARYSFNLSHAVSYAVLGYWCAWLKYHYPAEFLTAVLSTVEKERIPEFVREARRMGYPVLLPDINGSGQGFRLHEGSIRYGLDGVNNVGEATVIAVMAGQPYSSFEDFVERSGVDWGHTKTLVRIGAFDSLGINRKALETQVEFVTSGDSERCVNWNPDADNHGLPCDFDWEGEPVTIGRSGRPLKGKPVPKKCTKACRQYVKRPPLDGLDQVQPYSAAEIRAIEGELLGIHLSSTEFDRIPPDLRETFATGTQLDQGLHGAYSIAAIVERVHTIRDRNGKAMAFLTLLVQDAGIETVAFSKAWAKYRRDIVPDQLCLAEVIKNDSGYILSKYQPIT